MNLEAVVTGIILATYAVSLFPSAAASTSQYPTLTWSAIRTHQSLGYGIAVGSDGVYVAGGEDGNALLAKYGFDGDELWNATWVGFPDYTKTSFGMALGADAVYVVGMMGGYGQSYAFLVKFDLGGKISWNRTWTGDSMPTVNYARGVAVGSDGVYVMGRIWRYGIVSYQAFLAKYDFDGIQLWNVSAGVESDGYGVAVGDDGVYVVADVFLAKYDSNGNQQWNRTTPGTGRGVAVDGNSLYVVGNTNPGHFGATGYDALLVKYDPEGNQLWNRTWGGSNIDLGHGVAADGEGIYIVGETEHRWFENGYQSDYHPFIASCDFNGNLLWNASWTIEHGYGEGIATGSGIYIVGHTSPTIKAFLARYDLLSPPNIADFQSIFATKYVRVIYPSDKSPKPLGCLPALVSDWEASAFVTTKLQNFTEGLDTNATFVNPSSGKPKETRALGS